MSAEDTVRRKGNEEEGEKKYLYFVFIPSVAFFLSSASSSSQLGRSVGTAL